jgi:phosphoglycerate dehydrogenase-like enzyme
MMNAARFAQMRDGAFLLNMARGPLVDESALVDALNSGKLAGAGLDVFDPEPPVADSPLRGHPKVIATPHSASVTAEGRTRMERMAVERIVAFFNGEWVESIVNPDVMK